jgi:hypothetical protein
MTEFDPKWPQKFDKKSIDVLVKKWDKILLSPEIWELLNLIWVNALEILNWVEDNNIARSYLYWEKLNIAKKWEFYETYAKNIYPFVLENNKIILEKLEN